MNHKVHKLILLTWVLSTLLLTNSSPVALKLARVVGHGAEQISQEILCMCVGGCSVPWLWSHCSFLQPFPMSQWPAVIWKGSFQLQVSLICKSYLLSERSLLGLVCIPIKVIWTLFYVFNYAVYMTSLISRWSHRNSGQVCLSQLKSATETIFIFKHWDVPSGTRDESAVSWGYLNSRTSPACR